MNATLAVAVVLAFLGFFSLSQATRGVGILAVAIIFAIVARIQQAHDHTISQRTDGPPTLIKEPSGWVMTFLALLAIMVIVLAIVLPIFSDVAELQRLRDSIK